MRAFLDIMPVYEAPLILDSSELEGLFGEIRTTDCGDALSVTLDWMVDTDRP